MCALIEGTVALQRGDRELAAEWFAVAVAAGEAGQDRRDVVEALVGLAASSGSAEVRRAVGGGVSARRHPVAARSGNVCWPRAGCAASPGASLPGPGILHVQTLRAPAARNACRCSARGWRERTSPLVKPLAQSLAPAPPGAPPRGEG